jgi:predicted TIM-barrel fold metal-dependent hydrolase
LEFDFDATRAVTSLLVKGTFTRFPDIHFIVNHSGAAVPALAGRIQDRIPKDRSARLPKGAIYELQRRYYEVAHATYPWPMAALAKFLPAWQILFGTDYFFEPFETTVDHIPESGLSSEVWQRIYRGNAEELFPRLKT